MTDDELAEIESRLSDVIRATGDRPTRFEIGFVVEAMEEGSLRMEDVHALLAEVKRLRAQWDESPRWEVRVKELERRADVARLALAGGSP